MKKSRKVYGVYNIVEWLAIIKAGKASVKVLFSGGAMTTQGVTPATHSTTNPVVQLAIERSSDFRSGKIRLIETYPLDGEVVVERNAAKADASAEISDKDQGVKNEGDGSSDEADKAEETDDSGPLESSEIKFACNEDARDYLEEHFGAARSKLKTRADIAACGQEHGVSIVF